MFPSVVFMLLEVERFISNFETQIEIILCKTDWQRHEIRIYVLTKIVASVSLQSICHRWSFSFSQKQWLNQIDTPKLNHSINSMNQSVNPSNQSDKHPTLSLGQSSSQPNPSLAHPIDEPFPSLAQSSSQLILNIVELLSNHKQFLCCQEWDMLQLLRLLVHLIISEWLRFNQIQEKKSNCQYSVWVFVSNRDAEIKLRRSVPDFGISILNTGWRSVFPRPGDFSKLLQSVIERFSSRQPVFKLFPNPSVFKLFSPF